MITINNERTRKKSVTFDKGGMMFCLEDTTDRESMSCEYHVDGDFGFPTKFSNVKSIRISPFTLNPGRNVLFARSGLNMTIRGKTTCSIDDDGKLACDKKKISVTRR